MDGQEQKNTPEISELNEDELDSVVGGGFLSRLTSSLRKALSQILPVPSSNPGVYVYKGGTVVVTPEESQPPLHDPTEYEQSILDSMPRPGTGNPADDDPGVPGF